MNAVTLRGLTLSVVLVSFALAIASRIASGPVRFEQRSTVDILAAALARDQSLGDFAIAGALPTEMGALRLRSPTCEGPLIVSAGFVGAAVPEDLAALGYDERDWQTAYVFSGRVYRTSPRLWAHIRYMALRLWGVVMLRPVELEDQVLIWFHVPRACTLTSDEALGVAEKLLGAR